MVSLPTGTVTFLFSDIEGSTRHERAIGTDAWSAALATHNGLLRDAIAANRGVVVKLEGDAFFAVFTTAADAVSAAVAGQRALAEQAWPTNGPVRVRIGLHTGTGRTIETPQGEDYVGMDVNLTARIAAAGNGGQIVVSSTTADQTGRDLPDDVVAEAVTGVRLKDFDEPRTLVRVVVPGSADDPRPLRALEGGLHIPSVLTSFVGRETELADVRALLGQARLVTLTGPGGTGKTRLSLAAGIASRSEYPDGVWFVELAPIRDPLLVPPAIAAALELRDDGTPPPLELVKGHLRDRMCLLILDNFEQVVGAGGSVGEILRACPGVRALASSREALRVAGEQEYRVPPLGGTDAVTLFVERARLVRPGFAVTDDSLATIQAICDRLDHLPLAIELAAARIRLFPPVQLLARLENSLALLTGGARDLPARQQTLRGAIAWSHDLLLEPERRLFRRLAVFSGGWTIEAAAAVAASDGDLGIDVLDGLESLVDKSLATEEETEHGEIRFARLATIREYALEVLEASGEWEACERRHAEFFLTMVLQAEPELEGGDAGLWAVRLDHDQHNLRAAIRNLAAAGEHEKAMLLAGASWRFWHLRALLTEGRALISAVLEGAPAGEPTVGRYKAFVGLGGLVYWQSDFELARKAYEEALAIAVDLADRALEAEAHYNLGFIAMAASDLDELRRHHGRSAALFTDLGIRQGRRVPSRASSSSPTSPATMPSRAG